MKGREIIARILEENGLDREYVFSAADAAGERQEMPKATCLSDICQVVVEDGEAVLYTCYPLLARRFGLSDKYEKYVWDGESMYVHEKRDEAAVRSLAYGGTSTTCVTPATKKWRDAVVKEMVKQVADNDLSVPEWMQWRVRRFRNNKDVLSVF